MAAVNNLIIVRAWYGGPHNHSGQVRHGSNLEHGWLWQTGDRKGKDVTEILLSKYVRNGELNFNPERRPCNDLFGLDPVRGCWKILVVQYKYGMSGQVQTWFSESVGNEPYHCFLPASPPPLPVRIVFPDGTDDVSQRDAAGRKRAIDLDDDAVTTPPQRVRAADDDADLTTRVAKAHSLMQPQVDAAYRALLQPHFSAYAAEEIDAAELDQRKQRAHEEVTKRRPHNINPPSA